jgi:outer membrane protein
MSRQRKTTPVHRLELASVPRLALTLLLLGMLGMLGSAICAEAQSEPRDVSFSEVEPRHVSFSEAVTIALEQNSSLQRAQNETVLARTAVTRAQLQFVPDLGLGLSSGKSFGGSGEDSESGASVSASLSSRLTLFDGLANVAGLRQAHLQAEASGLDAERTRQTVVFQVISGYLAMIEASEQARVRAENLAAQEEQELSVRALVEEGERAIADLYQQQANVAAARLSVVETRRTLDLSRIDLVQALQLDPAGEYVFEIPPLPEEDAAAPASDLSALIERAFARRSDLRAVTLQEDAAGASEQAARGGRWPSVSLSASYGSRYSQDSDGAWLDQFEDQRSGSVGLSLSLPLFDRLATHQSIEQAQIQVTNAHLSLLDMRQEVALQVRRAVLDRDAAWEQLRAAEAQAVAAEQALNATSERYAAGAATLYEVTLARADFVSATSARVRARYNLLWQKRLLDYYVGDLDTTGGLA